VWRGAQQRGIIFLPFLFLAGSYYVQRRGAVTYSSFIDNGNKNENLYYKFKNKLYIQNKNK
jgi:hypothetical protein